MLYFSYIVCFCSINKISSPESLRTKLAEAKWKKFSMEAQFSSYLERNSPIACTFILLGLALALALFFHFGILVLPSSSSILLCKFKWWNPVGNSKTPATVNRLSLQPTMCPRYYYKPKCSITVSIWPEHTIVLLLVRTWHKHGLSLWGIFLIWKMWYLIFNLNQKICDGFWAAGLVNC